MADRLCGCDEHKDGGLSVIGQHSFTREMEDDEFGTKWRWRCGCGSRGKWTYQHPDVTYHSWLTHAEKDQPRDEPLVLEPEERDLILLLRRHVAEIEALSKQSEVERAEWEAEHPGEFYSALSQEDSSGSKAYSQCATACADMALAAFELAAKTLGITGFQGSFAELDFLRRSRRIEGPFGIYQAHDLLYPQYDVLGRVEKALTSEETVRWLGDEAEKMLATRGSAAPNVVEHWHRLVAARDALPPKEDS